ncbi:MAG: ATP synthase F1 complex subunit delta [Candidatus Westeberhardia cardiocondylae]|nr:ATP synthase F1 complex subunit delta [Candidatus Westeberhardia cardiocondylae]
MCHKFFITSYAKAIFELSVEQGKIQDWENMLVSAVIVSKNKEMRFLLKQSFSYKDKIADIFIDICGDVLDIYGKRLILILSQYNKLLLLPRILKMFIFFKSKYEKNITAEVISAFVLTKKQKNNIILFVQKKFFSKVLLNCRIDNTIISGFIIRVQDMVLDYSGIGCIKRLQNFLNN